MNRIQSLLKREPKLHLVHLTGQINTVMTYKVYKALKKFDGNKSKGIAMIINSAGGSPAQAYVIYQKFNQLRLKYNIPIYTFAEDYALSSAFMLLQMGDKAYCDESSLIGSAGTMIQHTKYHQLLAHYDLDIRHFSTSTKGTIADQLNPLVDTPETEDLQKLNDYQNTVYLDQLKQLLELRKWKPTSEQESNILSGQIILGKDSVAMGLCNGFGNYMQTLKQLHPDTKVADLSRKTQHEKLMEFFQNIQQQSVQYRLRQLLG